MKSLLVFLIGVVIGITPAIIAQVETPRPPRSHAAKLRSLAQQAQQLAAEVDPPLPVAPAHVVALENPPMVLPGPMPVQFFEMTHPSGIEFTIKIPPTMVTIAVPIGYVLTNRVVRDVTLDAFNDFKATNGSATIWFFAKP